MHVYTNMKAHKPAVSFRQIFFFLQFLATTQLLSENLTKNDQNALKSSRLYQWFSKILESGPFTISVSISVTLV